MTKEYRQVALKLSPTRDKDIIDYLDNSDLPSVTLYRRAMRAYIHHEKQQVRSRQHVDGGTDTYNH